MEAIEGAVSFLMVVSALKGTVPSDACGEDGCVCTWCCVLWLKED